MNAKLTLALGNNYPFDASNCWWESSDEDRPPPPPKDWSYAAARGVVADLQDRRGIKQGLQRGDIDEHVRMEIISTLAAIIRAAAKTQKKGKG